MESVLRRCAELYARVMTLPAGERYFQALFWSFFCYLLLFPAGYGIREVFPPVSFVLLLAYYKYNWHGSNLYRLTARWLFAPYAVLLVVAVAFSLDPWNSFLHVGRGLNKQLLIPFIALECVREEKDLRRLLWALWGACFWQGLDCLYQSFTGEDFIHGTPASGGRLTGSMGDYWVGNYFALALVPCLGIWCMLRQRWPRFFVVLLCLVLFFPAVYGMVFSGVRNALLTLAVISAVGWVYALSVRWKGLLFSAISILCCTVVFSGTYDTSRLALHTVSADGRWELWSFAVEVFREFPLFGSGAGQYNAAFRALGLAPAKDPIWISHPHDIYLQLLSETGVAGLLLALISLFGFLIWLERRFRPFLKAECLRARGVESPNSLYWRLTFFFWLGYAAFLVNGVVGHDFFRPWYQMLAFGHLGIALGAVLSGSGKKWRDFAR